MEIYFFSSSIQDRELNSKPAMANSLGQQSPNSVHTKLVLEETCFLGLDYKNHMYLPINILEHTHLASPCIHLTSHNTGTFYYYYLRNYNVPI